MAKKEINKCPTCGHRITSARWERLSSGLVNVLIASIQAVHRNGKNRFHFLRDTGLNYTQATNFQKLRFHGLIAHADEANPRNGEWLITKRGGQFLRGEIAIRKAVPVYDNVIQEDLREQKTEMVHIKDFRNLNPEFDSKFAYEDPVLVEQVVKQQGLFILQ